MSALTSAIRKIAGPGKYRYGYADDQWLTVDGDQSNARNEEIIEAAAKKFDMWTVRCNTHIEFLFFTKDGWFSIDRWCADSIKDGRNIIIQIGYDSKQKLFARLRKQKKVWTKAVD